MKDRKAFTIIEVVLVLAVAGLIFLVVFAAVPRLQASRRDNQRKRDVEAIFTLAIEFEGGHGDIVRLADTRLAFPIDPIAVAPSGDFAPFIENENFQDPSGSHYYSVTSTSTSPTNVGEIWMGGTGLCDATGTQRVSTGVSRDFAIIMKLERGHYCLDNPA